MGGSLKMKRIVAFSLFFCAIMVATVVYAQPPAETLHVGFPGKKWSVVINSPGFVVKVNGMQEDGREYLLATNDKNGMNVSVALERSSDHADANTCPEFLRKRVESLSGLGLQDVRYSTVGAMAVAEYLIPEVKGYKLRQKHLVACTAREDVYVDIHLSKVQFKADEEPLFTSLINAVSIADRSSAAAVASRPSETRELMETGSRYFLQQRYKEAIVPYQQALDLEKKSRNLPKEMWRALVDNLGMAYGITGDLANAEITFRYGLSEDPTYPMFFYNMACVYAERNDLDNTLEYLKKAFSYKANMIPGERMPDPQSDDSFQRFRANPRFRALMDSWDTAKQRPPKT
jgi:tetratricopeptide (TPR) repeat protein